MDAGFASSASATALRWPRILFVALLVWWSWRSAASNWIFLDFANLAFHEAGHLAFSFDGSTLHYLGGTLGQLLVPGFLAVHFLVRQRQPMGAAFCTWWVGQSLCNIATYMADARELALPLVGGGDHDWNELLFRFGLLAEPSVARVSGATRAAGVAIMLAGGAWVAKRLRG